MNGISPEIRNQSEERAALDPADDAAGQPEEEHDHDQAIARHRRAYQISVFSAQMIAITTATATIVQKIAITNPISELDRQRERHDQDDAGEQPLQDRRPCRAILDFSSHVYSVPRLHAGPGTRRLRSVVDALEVLEARRWIGGAALEPQPGEPVAPQRCGSRA